MPTLVFVHSPVATPATWKAVADLAQRAGYAVKTPALTDALLHPTFGGPPYLARCADIVALAARGCARPIFVAHSGAGLLLPAIATALGDSAAGAIIVDGLMPQPGKSWFETASEPLNARIRALARDGMVAPWHEWWPPGAIRSLFKADAAYQSVAAATPHMPLAFFAEAAPPMAMPAIPCAYLRLSAACDADADSAAALGWRVLLRDLNHIAMLTDPAAVWADLASLAEEIAPPKS